MGEKGGLRQRKKGKASSPTTTPSSEGRKREKESSFLFSFGKGDVFLLLVVLFYVVVCPYSKVEESFNLQATHDILKHQTNISSYDHNEFPGVVPRTFIGALFISILSSPFVWLLRMGEVVGGGMEGVWEQVIVRCVLGGVTVVGFAQWRGAIRSQLGQTTASLVSLLTAIQFHLPFYMSRTLPNTFALALTLSALSFWIRGKSTYIPLIVFAGCVFRSELVLLLGPLVLQDLAYGRLKFWNTVFIGFLSAFLSVLVSVGVDSVFWQRWLWPEGEVFFFNTVQNKSSQWGVSPFHWYFTNALPRSMLLTFPLALLSFAFAFWAFLSPYLPLPSPFSPRKPIAGPFQLNISRPERVILYLFPPPLVFLSLYSFLPHKELRFIFYSIPLLTLIAAVGLVWLLQQKGKKGGLLVAVIVFGLLLSGTAFCGISLGASIQNYPGGHAFSALHTLSLPSSSTFPNGRCVGEEGEGVERECGVNEVLEPLFMNPEPRKEGLKLEYPRELCQATVHIDVPAAQSGVSRYMESRCGFWKYSKEEELSDQQLEQFHFLVTAREHFPTHDIIHYQPAFSHLQKWPLGIKTKFTLFIHAHKNLTRSSLSWIKTDNELKETGLPKPKYDIHPSQNHWYPPSQLKD